MEGLGRVPRRDVAAALEHAPCDGQALAGVLAGILASTTRTAGAAPIESREAVGVDGG